MEAGDNNSSSTANIVAFSWLVSLVIVAAIAYFVGRSSVSTSDSQQFASLSPSPTAGAGITAPPQQQVVQSNNPSLNEICQKSGPSQKKDYLVPYILKEGDSFATIAEKELEDSTRVSELTALNDDQKQLVVGSTIYLPPENIKQSSGHIAEISGKIVKKDNASWQISYGGGEKGPGVLMPGFWFKDIAEAATFQLGDCVTILIDNGVKAYSVKRSS